MKTYKLDIENILLLFQLLSMQIALQKAKDTNMTIASKEMQKIRIVINILIEHFDKLNCVEVLQNLKILKNVSHVVSSKDIDIFEQTLNSIQETFTTRQVFIDSKAIVD